MSELVNCTTLAQKKRHLALSPRDIVSNDRQPDLPGHRYRTLCGNWGPDQPRRDAYHRNGDWYYRKPVVIADLPPCRQCDKAAAAWGSS